MSQLLQALEKRRNNHQQMQYNFVATIVGDMDASLSIESISAPFPTFDTKNAYSSGIYSPSASKRNPVSVSAKFIEDDKQSVAAYLYAWMRSIQNEDGTYNPPATYKKTITIQPLSAKLTEHATFRLIGAYISEVSPVSYDYDSTSNVYYEATIVCDDVVMGNAVREVETTSEKIPARTTKMPSGKPPVVEGNPIEDNPPVVIIPPEEKPPTVIV